MRATLLTLLLSAVVLAIAEVQELTSETFASFVADHPVALVSFVAPWCNYCQDFAPEFEAAAERLEHKGDVLGRVDCAEEKELCQSQGIPMYPTLLMFGKGEMNVYHGRRTAHAMELLVNRYHHPAVTTLASAVEATDFRQNDQITVMGYFDSDDKASAATFADIAVMYRDLFLFGFTSSAEFGRAENLTKPSILLYKSIDRAKETFSGSFEIPKIEDFLEVASMPLFGKFGANHTMYDPVFVRGGPVAFVFAEMAQERDQLAEQLRPIAESTKGRIVWMTADPVKDADLASQLALEAGIWPALAIRTGQGKSKYAYPVQGSTEALSVNLIREFADAFLAGNLVPSVRSEPVPSAQDDPVIRLVASTFDDTITASKKDAVVLYYSPTCPHCDAMMPTYDELGESLRSISDFITVAKIDATSNDVSPAIAGYPTLKLFRADLAGTEPRVFEGNRTLEGLLGFVKEHASAGVVDALEQAGSAMTDQGHDEL
ncbi:hypothetical protein ANO11243_017740 [Dothideomycetidae sp. 11243]|nr:hypothetical protein ANO11243_017740 [fungal sp. No.11243]